MAPRCLLAIGIAALASIGACDAPPASPSSAGARGGRVALAMCEAACGRDERCADAPCGCERARDTGAIRDDWAAASIACEERAPCDGELDCDLVASRAIGIAPLDLPPVVLRCLQWGDTCGGSSLACRRLAALTDDARAEVDRCFALDCASAQACFASFWRARVAPAVPRWR